MLAGSGHIAGVINPPEKNKYNYYVGDAPQGKPAQIWLKAAKEHKGSWWGHWSEWLKAHQQMEQIPALKLGNAEYPVIEAAPGSYVKVK